ncbi:hypothetical protein QUB08_13115 [Microcoleus sp. BR0-C5]
MDAARFRCLFGDRDVTILLIAIAALCLLLAVAARENQPSAA